MSENNEDLPKPVSAMSVVDAEPLTTVWESDDEVTEEPLRVSEPIPLVMNRKNDKVVIGTAKITVYKDRAEILGTFGDSEEAGEAAGLFSSNIVGGISIGAILSPEAASKLSEHLNS